MIINFNQKIVVAGPGTETIAVRGEILQRTDRALTIAIEAIWKDRSWQVLPEEVVLVVKSHIIATEETTE